VSGFQGVKERKIADVRMRNRKMQKIKSDLRELGSVKLLSREPAANRRRAKVQHYDYAYRCDVCCMTFSTGAVVQPLAAVEHAEAHKRKELITIREKEGDFYSDARTLSGSRDEQLGYRPWMVKSNKFRFHKHVFPIGNLTMAGEAGGLMRCRHPECEFRVKLKHGAQVASVRKTFYNSLRRHEGCCPFAPKQ
jgi:hypothetical protein